MFMEEEAAAAEGEVSAAERMPDEDIEEIQNIGTTLETISRRLEDATFFRDNLARIIDKTDAVVAEGEVEAADAERMTDEDIEEIQNIGTTLKPITRRLEDAEGMTDEDIEDIQNIGVELKQIRRRFKDAAYFHDNIARIIDNKH